VDIGRVPVSAKVLEGDAPADEAKSLVRGWACDTLQLSGSLTLYERRRPMTLINQLLKEKGSAYFSVHPDETVYSAIKKMGEKGIGSLLVMDRATLIGILTERDYARNVALKGRSSAQTLVREIMPAQFAYVEPDDTVEKSLALMTEKRIRYLPVVKDGAVVGIISIGDLAKRIIADQRSTIDQLEMGRLSVGVGSDHKYSKEASMSDSMYKVIELIGSSTESWERAAKSVVEEAAKHLRELRVAEVAEQDLVIENGKVVAYRTKVKVSFKYQGKE
jgi:CBS domain-containing protein/flavin-binding protein dodecin